MKPFLSLCLVVRDDEKVLKNCLDSVKDAVDEIIIVDTGSTDKTKEIAKSYVELIFEFQLKDNLADARNFAQKKATGEWILTMNADEFVDSDNLRESIEDMKSKIIEGEAFELEIMSFLGNFGEKMGCQKKVRLYKNHSDISFDSSGRDQLIKQGGELQVGFSKIVLYRFGYLNKKFENRVVGKNTGVCLNSYHSDKNSGFHYFNLGNEYLSQGRHKEALECYLSGFKNKKEFRSIWVSLCIIQIINCLILEKKYFEALNVIADIEQIYPGLAEFKYLRASVYMAQGRNEDAEAEVEELLSTLGKYQKHTRYINYIIYLSYLDLGKINKAEKDYERAVNHFGMALSVNHSCFESLYNLIDILRMNSSRQELISFIENQWKIGTESDLSMIIEVFISLYEVELAQKYISLIDSPNIKQGFSIKLDIIMGNEKPLSQYIKGDLAQTLNKYIMSGFFSIYDLIIYGLSDYGGSIHDILKEDEQALQLINFAFGKNDGILPKKENFFNLLERSLEFRKKTIFDELCQRVCYYEEFSLPIGHLLFKRGFYEEAINIYEKVNVSLYDIDTFVNQIQYSLYRGEVFQAWEWMLLSLSLGNIDYRLFEVAFELILNYQEFRNYDTKEILNSAFTYYPGSRKLIYLNSLIQEKLTSINNENSNNKFYTVGFFVETTFHYYVYESIINELVKNGVACHLVINDSYGLDPETSYMFEDLMDFINHLDRTDIDAFTVSMVKENNFKYDCMVSPYYSGLLNDLAVKQVRTVYGLLAKEFWNYSWWNVFYDKILCYSEYDFSRLNILNSCAIVGNPKFDNWFKKEIPNLVQVNAKFHLDKEKPTVLYAPTYGKLSSIDDWIEEINNLQNNYNVIIKLHHGTAYRESEKYRREYILNNFKNVSSDTADLFALFEISDYVITDTSSMIFEAMLAEQNILLLNSEFQLPIEENSGEELLRANIVNIDKGSNMKEYLGNSGLFEKQKKIVKEVINEVYKLKDGNSGKRAADEILKLLGEENSQQNKFLSSLRNQLFC